MVGGVDIVVFVCCLIFDVFVLGIKFVFCIGNGDFVWYFEEYGWMFCGGFGVGYFVKMVYNGIEYGIM